MERRHFLCLIALLPTKALSQQLAQNDAPDKAAALIEAAREQIGRTTIYDPAYVKLDYPGGDVSAERGVCTDVVIRAYREAFGLDLQKLVHEDMKANFGRYPKNWGLNKPDKNIDHRRVANLQTFFTREGSAPKAFENSRDYKAGDLVTMLLPGNLPHIGIVSNRLSQKNHLYVIHNIGRGTQEEDILFEYEHTGRYQYAI
jgi:uncharacterized protein